MACVSGAKKGWALAFLLLAVCAVLPASAQQRPASPPGLDAAVAYLCTDVLSGEEPDPARIAPIISHVRSHADEATALPEYQGAPGAYQGFPVRMPMQRLLRYLYNPDIPQEVIKPFSIRSSVWTTPDAAAKQRGLWAGQWPPAGAVTIRGEQYDRTTPDPSTGGCYGMALRRCIILLPQERAVLSVSVQSGPSEVGTKGYALGRDGEGRYVYSGEKGLTRTGLGWVSSRIQDNVSIGVYLEEEGLVASGVFQWMRAGWSGLSVVTGRHVSASLARYKTLMKRRLEQELPGPERLESLHAAAGLLSEDDLRGHAQGVFAAWLEEFGQETPREALKILEGGYERSLDRGELVALRVRAGFEPSGQARSGSSVAQASRPAPILSFQPLSTSR